MALSERITWLMELKGGKAVASEFESLGRTADRSLGKAETRVERFSAGFTKAGAGMLAAGSLAAVGLFRAGNAASDLGEAINFATLTFGDSADEIIAWSETTASSIGQSQRAALSAAADFGGLLQNLGFTGDAAADTSQRLVTLASDLASVKNTTPEEAIEALGAALRGESEPIRRYNVLLTDQAVRQRAVELGLARTVGAVDENGKAQARLSLIFEQTASAAGDYANTLETSVANQNRQAQAQFEDLQASIGQGVLPIMNAMLGAVNALVGAFLGLPAPLQETLSQVAAWGTIGVIATGAISSVVGAVLKLGPALSAAGAAFTSLNALLVAQPHLLAVAAALAAVAVAANELGFLDDVGRAVGDLLGVTADKAEEAAAQLEQTAQGARQVVSSFGDLVDELGRLSPTAIDAFTQSLSAQGLLGAFIDGTAGAADFIREIEALQEQGFKLGDTAGHTGAVLDNLILQFVDLNSLTPEAADELKALVAVFAAQARTEREAERAAREVTAALEDNADAAGEAQTAAELHAKGLDAQADAAQRAEDRMRGLYDATLAQFDATLGARDAWDDALTAIEDFGSATDDTNTVVDETAQAQRDAERAILRAGAAAVAAAEQQKGGALTAQEAVGAQVLALRGLQSSLEPGSPLYVAIQGYIDKLLEVPEERRTEIEASLDSQSLFLAQERLDALAENRTVTYTVNTVTTPIPARPASAGGGFQLAPINTNGPRSTGDGKSADIVVEVDGKELVRIVDEQLKREGGRVKLRG